MIEKAKDRLEVLEKIKNLENKGIFDEDVENDPPSITLLPNMIDYKRKKLVNKIKRFFTYIIVSKQVKKLMKANLFKIKEIKGIENLQNVKSGAILTCNHFNPADSFAIDYTFKSANIKGKRLFRIIRESNFTNPLPQYAAMMHNCNTLPLSSNKETQKLFLKSVNELLQEGNFILVYPEQSMWWNYKKPRPLKNGAYKFAVKNNVPVIPIFITMKNTEVIAPDGFNVQEYTINISKPLYSDINIEVKQNIENLKNINFEIWKDIYEKFYGIKLKYDIKNN